MPSKNPMEKLQRYLVYVLRHRPKELGLTLEQNGFVEIEVLLKGLRELRGYSWVEEQTIREVVAGQRDKKRLQIEGGKIRACYGHSAAVIDKINYTVTTPPDELYHGTVAHNLDSIRSQGLLPGRRRYVHLSDSIKQAQKVGARHGKKVVIIVVLASEACKSGVEFYHPEPLIWLTQSIAPQFLQIPNPDKPD